LETVRTRLRRAHATLRDDLESRADHETDWVAALVPLTGIRPDVAAAAQAAALGGAVMGTKTSIAAGLGVALAGVVAGSVLVGAAERPDTAEEIAALRARVAALESNASAAAARRDATGGGRRDAGIGDRVSAHDDRIAGVEAALDAVRADVKRIGTVETGTRAADRAAAPEVDADAELARLRALSSDELLTEIRTLNQAGAGGAGSAAQKKFGQSLVRACDVLLGRDTKGATRYQVLFIKGFGHRAQITANEQEHRAYAEAAFRDAMLLAGAGTDEAREAEKQIAWTAQRAGDPRAAAEIFVRLADDTRDTAASRAANRLSAAGAFDVAKDTARAAVELQSLIDEFAGAASAQASVELARTKLDELSRRARQR
jgi:hypothetical protein